MTNPASPNATPAFRAGYSAEIVCPDEFRKNPYPEHSEEYWDWNRGQRYASFDRRHAGCDPDQQENEI